VLLSVASTALLTAPAAWHRVLFHQGQRARVLRVANACILSGLACLGAAMTGTVLLITDLIIGGPLAIVLTVLTGLLFATLWFALPLRYRAANHQETT
jgi:hypothetical protein